MLNGSGSSVYGNIQHSDEEMKIMTFILSSEKKNELKNMKSFLPKIFPEKDQDFIHTTKSLKRYRFHLAMLFFKGGSLKVSNTALPWHNINVRGCP